MTNDLPRFEISEKGITLNGEPFLCTGLKFEILPSVLQGGALMAKVEAEMLGYVSCDVPAEVVER